MARTAVPLVTIRTTLDGVGYPHGVVAGMGTTPFLALADLKKRARATAEQLVAAAAGNGTAAAYGAAERAGAADGARGAEPELDPAEAADDLPPASLDFEVVGVLLTSGLLEDGYPGWCAYGTLRTPGGSTAGY